MTNERVVEVPWALAQLPQTGIVLDVGSCEATYLATIVGPGRELHCLDPRDCSDSLPPGVAFHQQSILENDLEAASYDAVLFLSTLEHIGLPTYGQMLFRHGDRLALAEAARLLRPNGRVILTLPVGASRMTTWFRQYSPVDLRDLFRDWSWEVSYWGYKGGEFVPIEESEVLRFEYRETFSPDSFGAGAVAGIAAAPRSRRSES
ncbi:MAG TPA: class I SAM-dependent methyltransferase [Thermoanaerobaculia bacterium]|nr:class I SAM-dependent methyltransferase [Thermoanaerobaculia bacterium]